MIIFFHEYIIPNPSASLNLHFKSNKIGYVNNDEISHMIDLIHCQQEELDLLKQGKIVEDERIVNDKRDDKKDDDKDKDDKDKDEKKDTPLLDQSYIRFLLAVAALIVINMVIINPAEEVSVSFELAYLKIF
ncbi:hypothetical protein QCA50_009343 [Cerrena zonata]|uniref:Uncharacterized protein n=1 Tax=Cerrena zonata TaxID=2478898 RepID=A0AAW0G506_9APHY